MTRVPADHVLLDAPPPPDDATLLARIAAVEARMKTRRTVRDFDARPVPRAVIEAAIRIAGGAPNGANLQPWHFVAISDSATKARIREGAEEEERAFYAGKAGEEWLDALAPLGTDASKPFLAEAPWLIVVFGERRTKDASGKLVKPYYVPESVNIAIGFLIAALHEAGLATLTHTPAPMGFLNEICGRPPGDKPYVLLVVGHPKPGATVPKRAFWKKGMEEIATFR
jgi:iodotyrosine deiodinase